MAGLCRELEAAKGDRSELREPAPDDFNRPGTEPLLDGPQRFGGRGRLQQQCPGEIEAAAPEGGRMHLRHRVDDQPAVSRRKLRSRGGESQVGSAAPLLGDPFADFPRLQNSPRRVRRGHFPAICGVAPLFLAELCRTFSAAFAKPDQLAQLSQSGHGFWTPAPGSPPALKCEQMYKSMSRPISEKRVRERAVAFFRPAASSRSLEVQQHAHCRGATAHAPPGWLFALSSHR